MKASKHTVWMRVAILLRKPTTSAGLLGMSVILFERVSGKLNETYN